jgi:hypothetical protein
MDDDELVPVDMSKYEAELTEAANVVREAFSRFETTAHWAIEDLDKVPPDRRLQAVIQFIHAMLNAERDYDKRIYDSLARLSAKMVLDLDARNRLELPDEVRAALEKTVNSGNPTIEGIGSFEDLINNVREPERPKDQDKRDFDGNYE